MKNKLVILFLVISLMIFLSVIVLNSLIVLERREIPAFLMVGGVAGFDVNKTALTFGTITPGSTSHRSLILENTYNFPVVFEFEVEGDIKDFLIFENSVLLNPGETKKVGISTTTAADRPYGNYSGKVIVVSKISVFN